MELNGSVRDLEALSRRFSTEGERIFRAEDGTFVYEICAEESVEIDEAILKAEQRVVLWCGVLRVERERPISLGLGAVTRIDPDGRSSLYVRPVGFADVETSVSEPVVTILDAAGNPVEQSPPLDLLHDAPLMGDHNPDVAKVLRLLGMCRVGDYTALFRVFEVIFEDVGGEARLIQNGWTSRTQIARFKHSCQHPLVAGDNARHGVQSNDPPSNPMHPAEADRYLLALARLWLKAKSESQDRD